MNTRKIGNFGENVAVKYLKQKDYQILDRNYSFRISGSPQNGEIDIVAKKEGIISFIEVKTLIKTSLGRQGSDLQKLGRPEEKVDFFKQKKLIKTAESWLVRNKTPLDSKWQIDIVTVNLDLGNKKAKVRHFTNI